MHIRHSGFKTPLKKKIVSSKPHKFRLENKDMTSNLKCVETRRNTYLLLLILIYLSVV